METNGSGDQLLQTNSPRRPSVHTPFSVTGNEDVSSLDDTATEKYISYSINRSKTFIKRLKPKQICTKALSTGKHKRDTKYIQDKQESLVVCKFKKMMFLKFLETLN